MRANVAALSFIELVGWKARMVEETSSIMPTSLSSSVTRLSDSLNAGPFGLRRLAVQFGHVERSHLQRAGVRVAAEKEPPEPFNITDTRSPPPSSVFRCRIGSKSHVLRRFDLGPCLHMLLLFLAS